MMRCCGLLTAQNKPVPLKSIEVELEVRDHVATVVSILNYKNKENKPLEAVFVFPLPGDAAVCHFSAKIGQTQIVAEVKEKQKEYDDALSSGQQAFLLEESDQSPDIFSLSVGSLPPGESASIRLEYVAELAVQADDGLRFCLPTVLNPRYQPQVLFHGMSLNLLIGGLSSVGLVPYSLSFSARVSSPRPISKVESNCSLDPLQYLNTDQTQATVKLAAGHKFDRDVELLIYYKDAHQPTAVVEAGQASAEPGSLMGDPVVMVSLYPEFPQSAMASCGEFVFLMDRSGSMISNCSSHTVASLYFQCSLKDTLLLLLKSLPMGCYFNIYSFGSCYEHIFPKSVEYSQQTIKESLKKVEQMEANLGGTEILEPLKYIYSQPFTHLLVFLIICRLTIHRLGARTLIRSLEMEEREHRGQQGGGVKEKVVHLSVQSGVSSSFTAFIAVNKDNSKVIQGPLVRRNIPTASEFFPIAKLKVNPRSETKMVQISGHPIHSSLLSPHYSHLTITLHCKKEENVLYCKFTVEYLSLYFLIHIYVILSYYSPSAEYMDYYEFYYIDSTLYVQLLFHLCTLSFSAAVQLQPPRDPLLQLVFLQEASGYWRLDPALATALGKISKEMEKSKPEKVGLWATILALIWLHAFKMDAKDEWELLAMKAASWLRAQNAPCVSECVDAGNVLLGSSVKKEALGL
uniref:VIT domain-containing protein n=1 Tax=Pundamilia nyererei TaxID=303518 RepID=A0A3B4G8H2_9CICH